MPVAGRARPPALLLSGFVAALVLRVALGAPAPARSASAGLVFAAALVLLALAHGMAEPVTPRAVGYGTAGTVVLLAPVVLSGTPGTHRPGGAFLPWAGVVVAVAMAEEAFLRGALFRALQRWRGTTTALLATTAAFAALHVPLYGWGSVPLNAAVGLCLGTLRLLGGTWWAPALAHAAADVAGWWLR